MHQPILPLEATHLFELYILFPSRSQRLKWRSRTGIANLEVWKIILETKTMDPIFSLPFYLNSVFSSLSLVQNFIFAPSTTKIRMAI